MSLNYDGSLLDHLTAHMPLHCIIIVVPPSCPFVAPACCCLLRYLCCWHLCHTSLFRLIVVFTPPVLPPLVTVTKKSLRHCTPCCKRVISSTPLLLSALSSFHCAGWLLPNTLPLLLVSLPMLCPCQRSHCTGIITVIVLASLPSLPLTLPSSTATVK
jgi:hypothetical protein